ncbi:MAG: rhodanese-like domain-containing protein [Flavobacteriales bacterium]
MRSKQEPFQLIDIREPYEIEICHIGGQHIPMAEILDRKDEINREIPVIIHCRSGKRSSAVVNALETHFGLTNVYNLKGGILAWANEIDTSLEQY